MEGWKLQYALIGERITWRQGLGRPFPILKQL